MIVHDKGEGGLANKLLSMLRGDGGVQTPPKTDDIIREQPLTAAGLFNITAELLITTAGLPSILLCT